MCFAREVSAWNQRIIFPGRGRNLFEPVYLFCELVFFFGEKFFKLASNPETGQKAADSAAKENLDHVPGNRVKQRGKNVQPEKYSQKNKYDYRA